MWFDLLGLLGSGDAEKFLRVSALLGGRWAAAAAAAATTAALGLRGYVSVYGSQEMELLFAKNLSSTRQGVGDDAVRCGDAGNMAGRGVVLLCCCVVKLRAE